MRVAALCLVLTAAAHANPPVKFIELGWDIPDTEFLRAHVRAMEATTPFDGVIFEVAAKREDGRAVSTQTPWNADPWVRAWFEPALADLRACAFTNFTDNFIRFNATAKCLGWTDDDAWAALAGKVRICGWIAREAGLKGIAPDFEPYGENQWKYDAATGRSFAETARLARRRGAEFTRALAAEKPDAVVLTLFLNSVVLRAGRSDDPAALLAKEPYGLLPAFLDGMLDAAPPEMVIVDGIENGYYLDSDDAYQRTALDVRAWNGPAAALVAPENRATYRRQVQAGFGFYLDMFLNEEGNNYYRGPLDGSRVKHLARNLSAARDASDGYVWLYGEQCRWWPDPPPHGAWLSGRLTNTVGRGRRWEEAMPGINAAIAWVRDPAAFARAEVARQRAAGTASNLLANGDFAAGPAADATLPPGWGAWQHEKESTGRFGWSDSAASASNVTWGCLLQKITVRPGEAYAVQADALPGSPTLATVTIRWQTAGDAWTHEADDRTIAFTAGTNAWRQAFGVVTVPPGAGKLAVLLDVRGQAPGGATCLFDNVVLHRLPPPP